LISNKLKFLLAAASAALLIVMLARAVHTYAARADMRPRFNGAVSPGTGQIIPSYRPGILACGMPISECEKIIMMIPMNLKFSPREIQEPMFPTGWPSV
jgi:hypothetical protein